MRHEEPRALAPGLGERSLGLGHDVRHWLLTKPLVLLLQPRQASLGRATHDLATFVQTHRRGATRTSRCAAPVPPPRDPDGGPRRLHPPGRVLPADDAGTYDTRVEAAHHPRTSAVSVRWILPISRSRSWLRAGAHASWLRACSALWGRPCQTDGQTAFASSACTRAFNGASARVRPPLHRQRERSSLQKPLWRERSSLQWILNPKEL